MATTTATQTKSTSDALPPRYEIRQLTDKDIDAASAIVLHSNCFHSPVWSLVYPEAKTQRCYDGVKPIHYLVKHQIDSGMSFGIFDKEYKFKRPESAATGGKLYWDESNKDATGDELLEQMDFSLVTVALAYDGFNHLDMQKLAPVVALLPLFGTMYGVLAERDTRDPASWEVKGPGEVLMRNATSSRRDYEGQRLMGKLARFLMREAAAKGYRLINIETAHDAVYHVWMHPPPPFKAELVSYFTPDDYEIEEDGKKVKPYLPSKQQMSKVVVHLK